LPKKKFTMTATVTYLGELRTEATHLLSGTKIITDAPPDNQGKGEAFSPTDLCATSLAACMITIMGISARNHGLDMTGAHATINKIMASDPRRIARVEINITMPKTTSMACNEKCWRRRQGLARWRLAWQKALSKSLLLSGKTNIPKTHVDHRINSRHPI
jgi:putative redox protein